MMISADAQAVRGAASIEHTCCSCGRLFGAVGAVYKCDACRRPKLRGAERLNRTLSPRENQIIALVCEGKENKEIAYSLRLTEYTVKTYMARILRKTGAVNRVDLAVRTVLGRL